MLPAKTNWAGQRALRLPQPQGAGEGRSTSWSGPAGFGGFFQTAPGGFKTRLYGDFRAD